MSIVLDENVINESTPEESKAKGAEAFGKTIAQKGVKFAIQLTPRLIELVNINIKPENICLPPDDIKKITDLRNNIVGQANNISKTLDILTKSILGVSSFLDITIFLIQTIKGIKIATSAASSVLPVTPGFIPAAISNADDAITLTTFDKLGTSRLIKLKNITNKASVPISLTNRYIKQFIDILNNLDNLLIGCASEIGIDLTPVDPNLIRIANEVEQAEKTKNQNTYQGFKIEIETIPYTPTVNRKRAIGLNQDNIKLIETTLSFTTNDQTLIDELKFIIDRDNLKAY